MPPCGVFAVATRGVLRHTLDPQSWSRALANELWRGSLQDLAQAIRTRKVSSTEVVQAHLQRIDAVDPRVNALPEVLRDAALQAAAQADHALAQGAPVGPLHGVPFTVKLNIDLAGSATTSGVPALREAVPLCDAPHVAQLRDAGAIPLARGNMPDFGFRWHTDSSLHGASINPWDARVTPGGSSGGEAIALATGMTPLGLGNDFGGSLRYPALCCGVAALRPTLGRVARAAPPTPVEPPLSFQMFSVHGPMARHVRDLRLALTLMSAADARDPWCVPAPLAGPPLRAPIKVAVCVDPGASGVHVQVAEGVRKAARCLQQAGYDVEEIAPPQVQDMLETYMRIIAADVRSTLLPAVHALTSPDTQRFVDDFMQLVPESTLPGYIEALARRNQIARAWALFQQDYPLLLAPVSTQPPFAVGFDLAGVDAVRALMQSMALSVGANLLGLPAVAVSVGVAQGLPQGVQLIGARYREDVCLDAAECIERAVAMPTPSDPRC